MTFITFTVFAERYAQRPPWVWAARQGVEMGRRAVIFDDNDSIRRNLWYFFDQRGYEVFTFPEPGVCALHVVRECPCPANISCAEHVGHERHRLH